MPSLETTAKNAVQFCQLEATIPRNTPINIAFLGSENLDDRVAAVAALHASGLQPRPIISARRQTSTNVLKSYLSQAVEAGQVRGVFLVGGDPSTPKGPLSDSLQLINGGFLDGLGIETVGVAGYPEGHPRISSDVLARYLKLKTRTLADKGFSIEITTKLSFNVNRVISWIEEIRHAGIDAPIRIGMPSPTTLIAMLKFAQQCRVETSAHLLHQYGWRLTSLLDSTGPNRFLDTLSHQMSQRNLGTLGLHIFQLGQLDKAIKWLEPYRSGILLR